jgi:hypothetical protein
LKHRKRRRSHKRTLKRRGVSISTRTFKALGAVEIYVNVEDLVWWQGLVKELGLQVIPN